MQYIVQQQCTRCRKESVPQGLSQLSQSIWGLCKVKCKVQCTVQCSMQLQVQCTVQCLVWCRVYCKVQFAEGMKGGFPQGKKAAEPAILTYGYSLLYSTVYNAVYIRVQCSVYHKYVGCPGIHWFVTNQLVKIKLSNYIYSQLSSKPNFNLIFPFIYPVLDCKNVQNFQSMARQKFQKKYLKLFCNGVLYSHYRLYQRKKTPQ